MKSTALADAKFRSLADDLKIRLKGSATIDTVRAARDAQGWPVLVLSDGGAEAAGDAVIVLRMKAQDAVSKDIFGNDLVAFAPHTVDVAYEQDANGKPTPAAKDVAIALHEATRIGAKVAVKETANTDAVLANLETATTIVELDWLQFPTKLA